MTAIDPSTAALGAQFGTFAVFALAVALGRLIGSASPLCVGEPTVHFGGVARDYLLSLTVLGLLDAMLGLNYGFGSFDPAKLTMGAILAMVLLGTVACAVAFMLDGWRVEEVSAR